MKAEDGGERNSQDDIASETSSQKAENKIKEFELEKLSQKVILVKPANIDAHEGTLMVQHNEAVYQVRKQILERAKNFWKEAKDMNSNQALGLSSLKQKNIDNMFE